MMTQRDRDRLVTLKKAQDRKITQKEAAEQMQERQVGSALVVDGDLVVGVLTRSDMLRALCDAYR